MRLLLNATDYFALVDRPFSLISPPQVEVCALRVEAGSLADMRRCNVENRHRFLGVLLPLDVAASIVVGPVIRLWQQLVASHPSPPGGLRFSISGYCAPQ